MQEGSSWRGLGDGTVHLGQGTDMIPSPETPQFNVRQEISWLPWTLRSFEGHSLKNVGAARGGSQELVFYQVPQK